jgi:hypothetical protein
MQKISPSWYVLLTVIVGSLLVAINMPLVWSTSVDLAHHYALVFRLSEHWQLVPGDATLGEMNTYPRGSHLAAALVGKLFDSPFLGMQVVALASLVLAWASCLSILYAAPGRTGPFNAIVLALVVLVNFGALRIHGSELSNNYFFAQLAAQALALMAVAIAIRLETRHMRVGIYVFLIGAICLIGSVHMLPAVELLAVLAGLLVVDVVLVPVARRERIQRALVACVMLAIGIASVVLNPAFAAMRSISDFNAGISLGPLAPLWAVALVSVIALASAVSLLRAWHRDPAANAMYKYLGLYGTAVAGLCLLHMVLARFHIGSDYAAKKYAAGVVTFLFMRLALWLGNKAAVRMAGKPAFLRFGNHPAFGLAVFAIALAATVSGAARMRHGLETGAVVALERQLKQLPAGVMPPPAAGKQNLVVDLKNFHNVVSYMFSLTVAHTSRETAQRVFPGDQSGSPQVNLAEFGTILTSPRTARFASAAQCATAQGATLLLVDAACAQGATLAASPPVAPALP